MPENASQEGIAAYETFIEPRPADQRMSAEERRRLWNEGGFSKAYAQIYNLGDNFIGFDDAYETRGEALGKGIGTFVQDLVSDPIGVAGGVAGSMAESFTNAMNRSMATQLNPETGVYEPTQDAIMATTELASFAPLGGVAAVGTKAFSTFDPNTLRSFIGPVGAENLAKAGKPVAQEILTMAKSLDAQGVPESQIRLATNKVILQKDPSLGGVSKDAEGNWVVELSDDATNLSPEATKSLNMDMAYEGPLSETLTGSDLPTAYPDSMYTYLERLDPSEITLDKSLGSHETLGFGAPSDLLARGAELNSGPNNILSTLMHEGGGHGAAYREGRQPGGNLEDVMSGKYYPMQRGLQRISNALKNSTRSGFGFITRSDLTDVEKKAYDEYLADAKKFGYDALDASEDALNDAGQVGYSPKFAALEIYKKLAGEVEARNVQARRNFTPSQRRTTPPTDTEDVPRSQQIIRDKGEYGNANMESDMMFENKADGGVISLVPQAKDSLFPRGGDAFLNPRGYKDGGSVEEPPEGVPSKMGDMSLLESTRTKIMNDYGFDPVEIALEEGLDPELVLRVIYRENKGKQGPVSQKGAIGLMQLMPETAAELGVNPNDPKDNVRGGIRYLKKQLKDFKTLPLALAAYNAGPTRVRQYGGVPPFLETRNYIAEIAPMFGDYFPVEEMLPAMNEFYIRDPNDPKALPEFKPRARPEGFGMEGYIPQVIPYSPYLLGTGNDELSYNQTQPVQIPNIMQKPAEELPQEESLARKYGMNLNGIGAFRSAMS